MVIGLGIDMVETARIEKAMRLPNFVKRILTANEREICTTAERVAGRWAAKEALSKALPALNRWQDVEILSDEAGKPVVPWSQATSVPARIVGKTLGGAGSPPAVQRSSASSKARRNGL